MKKGKLEIPIIELPPLKCDNCGKKIKKFPFATLHYSPTLDLNYCSQACLDDRAWNE